MKIKTANVRTVELPGALGSITISGEFNFFKLAGHERRFVLDLLDAFDLLQEKLLEEGWEVSIYKSGDGIHYWIELGGHDDTPYTVHATRARLWPEAYATAKGLGGGR